MTIKHIKPGKRSVLAGLFANHTADRMLIESVIQGDIGLALADSQTNPQVAQITFGSFTMFGGNAQHPIAHQLIQEMPKDTWVTPISSAWRQMMFDIHAQHLEKRQWIEFSSSSLDIDYLRQLKKRVPFGFEIKRVDIDLAEQVMNDDFSTFTGFCSLSDFVERGIGFCATKENQIVCYAGTYAQCKAGIEVQISTEWDFRRKGLATVVGATLVVHCLEHRIEPHWSAINPISAKLACKLGYVENAVYEELKPL